MEIANTSQQFPLIDNSKLFINSRKLMDTQYVNDNYCAGTNSSV